MDANIDYHEWGVRSNRLAWNVVVAVCSTLFAMGLALDMVTTHVFIKHPALGESNEYVLAAMEQFGVIGHLGVKAAGVVLFTLIMFPFTLALRATVGETLSLSRGDVVWALKVAVLVTMGLSGLLWLFAGLVNTYLFFFVV